MAALELIAVVLALIYVLLAIAEQRYCWLAAGLSAALYLGIFWRAALLMEAVLQLFYVVMAGYGWWCWGTHGSADERPIRRWPWRQHVTAIAAIGVLSGICGSLLDRYTDAALPWLDSLTTIGALVTTWMVAQKLLENWLYWIVIDALSIYLYLARDLHLTAGLFALYIALAFVGWYTWRQHYRRQRPEQDAGTASSAP